MERARLIFLGTAGDAIVAGSQKRASGGIILQTEQCQFHIDPGPCATLRALEYGVNPRANTAVLVTHSHVLHSCGVDDVISAMSYSGLDKTGVIVANRSENETSFSNFSKQCVEKFITLEPGARVGINNVDIRATPCFHKDKDAIGYKIFTPTFTVSIVGDTEYKEALAQAHTGSDVLVVNCKNPSDIIEDGNMNTDDVIRLVEKCKPSMVIITHYSTRMLKADPIMEARKIKQATGISVIAAKDGLKIDLDSYSSVKQTTMNKFK